MKRRRYTDEPYRADIDAANGDWDVVESDDPRDYFDAGRSTLPTRRDGPKYPDPLGYDDQGFGLSTMRHKHCGSIATMSRQNKIRRIINILNTKKGE